MAKSDAKAQLAEPDIDDRFRKGVGSLLRATRVRLGEDVQDVASVLRIRRTYLEAIEDGRTNDLPEPMRSIWGWTGPRLFAASRPKPRRWARIMI